MRYALFLLALLSSISCFTQEAKLSDFNMSYCTKLGEGAFGVVSKCTSRVNRKQYAVKKQSPRTYSERNMVTKEINMCKKITDYKILYTTPLRWYHSPAYGSIYMGFDVYNGDLRKYMDRNRNRKNETNMIAFRLLYALGELDSRNIGHFDIKPANILVNDRNRPHFADFGLSEVVSDYQKIYGARGTPLYMAPEVNSGSFGKKADVWALGLVLYELFSGKDAIGYVRTMFDLKRKINSLRLSKSEYWPNYPSSPSVDYRSIIYDMMVVKENRRKSAKEISDRYLIPYLKKNGNYFPSFLNFLDESSPEEVLLAEDKNAKEVHEFYGFSPKSSNPLEQRVCFNQEKNGKLTEC